jgi:hypothetical protein
MNEQSRQTESDFLGRLIDRASGRGNAIAPKLPSVFEPPQPSSVFVEQSRESLAEIEDEGLVRAVTQRSRTRGPEEESTQDSSELFEYGRARPPRAPEFKKESSEAVENPSVPAMTVTATNFPALVPSNTLNDAQNPTRHADSKVEPEPEEPVRTISESPQVEFRITSKNPDVPTSKTKAGGKIAMTPRSAVMPAKETTQPQSTGTLLPHTQSIAAVPSTVPRRSGLHHSQTSIQEHQPEPVINVTIGRIEVRATQDHAVNARRNDEPRGPKPLSLDEYLRQRGGRR